MTEIAAIILAAGRSTRFAGDQPGTTKLIAELDGKPLVRHVADTALASTARPVIVVTGHARELVQDALAGLPVAFVHNKDYATGLASSLRIGIAAVPSSASGAIILLGDMPLVAADLIHQLIQSFETAASAEAIVPVMTSRRGNPVLLARSLFPTVTLLTGDDGARRLLQQPGIHVVEIAVSGDAASADIDTPEALETLRKS
ncbi:MAG: molybdenum cofactor cytidylyltransferase [Methylobacteriaceae bacterium]|jgi:molybdenum cofactor cytidylyltransferase|nr:molybdenum cofactor cytidylyltransferase [Methylobacteriaceae bacterium]